METIAHDGRETAYRTENRGGDGRPLLCVHGSGGTHAMFRAQLARLSGDRPVVGVDLAGHGDSADIDTPAGAKTLDAYADDVLAVARETGAEVLLGNSLGGAVVQHVAIERGFEPAALILAGTGAKLSVLPDLLEWLAADFERAIEFLHEPDRLFHDPDERLRGYSMETMRSVGRAVTERDFRTCDAFDVRNGVGEIDAPTLALTGEHDELTPPSYHEYLAEGVERGEWTTLPEAAHLSMLEAPGAFNDAIREFLEKRED